MPSKNTFLLLSEVIPTPINKEIDSYIFTSQSKPPRHTVSASIISQDKTAALFSYRFNNLLLSVSYKDTVFASLKSQNYSLDPMMTQSAYSKFLRIVYKKYNLLADYQV